MSAAKKLVIVESPTKARTIRRFLSDEYRIEASMGHVRDLPASAEEVPSDVKEKEWARLGVNVEEGFEPVYIIPPGKKKVVTELKKAVKEAEELYLATDEDREGESIGWHLVEVLKPKIPVKRMVFHEITQNAIRAALQQPRSLDDNLVQAQETRRVLDRLVGYLVSPVLWKKVAPRLSAGRVQSAAVRLLVLRERERMAFKSGSYWDLKALLAKDSKAFEAQLVSVDGVRLASGKDFDEQTGKIPPEKNVLLLQEEAAKSLVDKLRDARFQVTSVETRRSKRAPYAPFTTSTLQQEANRKLGITANRTMRIAQRLYENGYITYMRTDSVNLSEQAIGAARQLIERKYGSDYVSPEPRRFATQSKGAQEAHEAIRPAGTAMPTVEELGLSGEEAKLYELIWKRTVATQMAEARLAFTTARMEAKTADGQHTEFRATGREVVFPGFFRAYVEGSDDPEEALEDRSQPLPPLSEGDQLPCQDLEPIRHDTKPPARYTEATLVKALEANGIGRPSTYATIIDTIQRRGYVTTKSKQLVPTFIAMAVTQLLEESLTQVVDLEFTAGMEERLDEIAEGRDALRYLQNFYKEELLPGVDAGENLDPKSVCAIKEESIEPYEIRVGRYGAFLEYTNAEGEKTTVSLPAEMPPGEVTKDYIESLIHSARRSKEPLGHDPQTNEPVYVLYGPYGPYVQLGTASKEKGAKKPKRVSIPKSLDPTTVDFQTALQLLALPRPLGEHPETGKTVKAGIGRFGPYVLHDGVYASLKAEDDVLTVELPRAVELLAGKKKRRGSEPLKELGNHPEDGNPVNVMRGPYGVYVKWNKLNVGVPEEVAPEDVTLERAMGWLEEKAAQKGKKKTSKKKAAASSSNTTSGSKKTQKKTSKKKASKKKTSKKTSKKKTGSKAGSTTKTTTKKKTASRSKRVAAKTATTKVPKRASSASHEAADDG